MKDNKATTPLEAATQDDGQRVHRQKEHQQHDDGPGCAFCKGAVWKRGKNDLDATLYPSARISSIIIKMKLQPCLFR